MTETTPEFVRRNQGKGHSYSLGGHRVPGVTSILSAGIPKPGLIGWASDATAEYVMDRLQIKGDHVLADELIDDLRRGAKWPIPPGLPRVKLSRELAFAPNRLRDAGAARGGKVHDLAMELATTGEADVPPELKGYVDAYLAWFAAWQPEAELSERPVLNRTLFYAGTFDLWCLMRDVLRLGPCRVCGSADCKAQTLVDYKTGKSGIFGETALQVAGYRYAEIYVDDDGNEQPMPEVDHCLGVWLRSDGTYDTVPITAGETEFRLFRYVYEVAKWMAGPDLFKLEGETPEIRKVIGEPIHPQEAPR